VVTSGPLTVEGIELEVVPLAGHSPGQVGYLVDGVFFCADVVLPVSVLEKYRIPYLYSVTDHLRALERAGATRCVAAVPGHGPIVDSLDELIDRNRALVVDVAARVLELAREPATAEAILTGLLNHYDAAVIDAPGFYLLQPTVFAFLSHLQRAGRLRHEVRNGGSLWTTAQL
jgi:glyoxylase-like metal-dependent hydrolase (beta-lactamase superfamily II)